MYVSEVKDPRIKLFGKTIELPETSSELAAAAALNRVGEATHELCDAVGEDGSIQDPSSSSDSMLEESDWNGDAEVQEPSKNQSCVNLDGADKDRDQMLTSEELKDSADGDAGPVRSSKTEEDKTETSNSQEKTLKKPDKIIPCPRCNSMDTKFCYFNNYNVNQPRHFCKNCQRYWTAGGTMRNVPVGAGRRKNKSSASQFRHLTVPDGLQNARLDLPNGIHHPVLSPSGTVIAFNSDAPLCESMVSVLNIADKTALDTLTNGFHRPEEVGMPMPVPREIKENGDDHSSGASTTAASSKDEVGKPDVTPNCHPFPPLVPCFPGAPWPYPWHSVHWTPAVSSPNFPPATASFPLPFYATPPPYWGCAVPGPWSVPWVIPPTPPSSGPNSPTLGKHLRDDNSSKPVNTEEACEGERKTPVKCLWIPKTLRIDDPGEAAKSSIWATLGIKNERADSMGGGGIFKAFQSQSKGDEKAQARARVPASETSTLLHANPAALSRSLSFHESS